jgi:hypothetical protein
MDRIRILPLNINRIRILFLNIDRAVMMLVHAYFNI